MLNVRRIEPLESVLSSTARTGESRDETRSFVLLRMTMSDFGGIRDLFQKIVGAKNV